MKKIAITGNIASGKSQVEEILAKEYPVFDADKIAHVILDDLNEFFGLDVFTNGKIDRKKLGDIVFKNIELKQKLEEIIHPKVKEEILKIFDKHKNDKFVFISIPLLFEAKMENLFDKIIFISAKENIRLERLMHRNNLTKEDALLRIKSQMPEEEKIKKSNIVIFNNFTKKELIKNINNVILKLD